MRPFKIFIGYDPREKIAFHVLSQSIIEHSSIPVSISPINLSNLRKFYKRKKRIKDSTEFSISRIPSENASSPSSSAEHIIPWLSYPASLVF